MSRTKEREAQTEQRISKLSALLLELKGKRQVKTDSNEHHKAKLKGIKSELDESRSTFKKLEAKYEERMEQILLSHKNKLKEHVQTVKHQAQQIKHYNKTIDSYKHQIEIAEVN
eukprot:TRINITY_DN12188_c0_g1_i1.p1 TRINITY_DN12188_c0_g1~~TRINITY_DN12188_c0_g1_i1.p1  ORF type:complete len:114 (-),score=28.22 TRINITY_DN12188_c0_g1_i1:441-782(-)